MKKSISGLFVVLLAAAPFAAQAAGAVGGAATWSREHGGSFDGSDAGWKVTAGGYTKFLGGELGYIDFGKLGDGTERSNAISAAVVANIPLPVVTPFAKFGAAFQDVKHTSVRDEYHDTRAFYGVGARIGVVPVPGLGLRVEYERYPLKGENLDVGSVGLEFRF